MIQKMYVQNSLSFMKQGQNKILVIGGNHHNTLGVIRSLGYKGLKPDVLLISDIIKPYVSYSRYIEHLDIIQSETQITEYLIDNRKKYDNKPVIISCADIVTSELDSNFEKLSDFYTLPIGKGNLTQIMNKQYMCQIANECGILTPISIYFKNIVFDSDSKYIIKPLKSINGAKSDIAIIKNIDELNNYFSSSHCENIQIQKYIDKELEFQLIGCSLNSGETVIIPGASIILRQPDNTNTGFLKYVPLKEFQYDGLENCKQFIRTIGYSGLFSMEFLRGKDGKDYFMEINMRNDGNAICVTAAGVNLPYIWYSYCSGSDEWQSEAKHEIKETIVMPEYDDFVNVLKRKISLVDWIKDVRRTDCFMEYDKTDKRPFYIGLRAQLTNYFKLFLKKIHITK